MAALTTAELQNQLEAITQERDYLAERLFQADLVIIAARDVVQRSARRLSNACFYERDNTLEDLGRQAPVLASKIALDLQDLRHVLADVPPE